MENVKVLQNLYNFFPRQRLKRSNAIGPLNKARMVLPPNLFKCLFPSLDNDDNSNTYHYCDECKKE